MDPQLTRLLTRFEEVLTRWEASLPPPLPAVDWSCHAYRWCQHQGRGVLQGVAQPHRIAWSDLQHVDRQWAAIERNTRQFVRGKPANNVLLTGARGTGKSSLIKATLHAFVDEGLRLIEVDKTHLVDLPDIVALVRDRAERFILFCDDLTFEQDDDGYKMLKSVLDGSIAGSADNVLVYATSNRRHLIPQNMRDNLERQSVGDEIHPGETVEEKVSLSERFGLWLSFYPFSQDEYLTAVYHWLGHFGCSQDPDTVRAEALLWALSRGSRSGRVAYQFARDLAGRHAL